MSDDHITGSYAYWHLTREEKQAFHDQQGEHMQIPTPMAVSEHTLKARTEALERTIADLAQAREALRLLLNCLTPYIPDLVDEDGAAVVETWYLVPKQVVDIMKKTLAPQDSAE